MPKDEFALDDPMELVGVEVPAEEDTVDEMARCFVEEFVRLGYPDKVILHLFKSPFFAGSHLIYRRKGEGYVRALIEEIRAKWAGVRFSDSEGGD